ncbi:MAG TPA: N-acetyltransferase [Terracidiphilus sp.]|jgi:ribosomal-protein-alanine N-acetyltransferase|nr:N-acetyltransferase [Terracidiphilus sp.]
MHFRLNTPADFPALYAIEEVCFQPPIRYSRLYLQRLIASPRSATWVAEEDAQIAGFTIVEWFDDPDAGRIAYIQTIEVSPDFRRRGIASELLRRAEAFAESAAARLIWLHVESTNDAAIRLYRAHGFTRLGSEPHYYARGRNAEVYSKTILSAP